MQDLPGEGGEAGSGSGFTSPLSLVHFPTVPLGLDYWNFSVITEFSHCALPDIRNSKQPAWH